MASSTRIAQRYALALKNQALSDNQLEQVATDMQTVMHAVNTSDELTALLNSPVIRHHAKVNIFKELFGTSISSLMMNFLIMVTEKSRESILPDIASAFTDLYNAEKNLLPVHFTTAIEVDEAMKTKLIDMIAKKMGKTVVPQFSIDESIKGGITIRIADTMIDASLRHQLDMLYRELTGSATHSMA